MRDELHDASGHEPPAPMDRREALKVIATAAAGATLGEGMTPSIADAQQPPPAAARKRVLPSAPTPAKSGPRGTPTDPDLVTPSANWPRLLSAAEMTTLAALCDTIIPADDKSPSASAVGAHRYINEYVSAPYDWAEPALIRVRGGLVWLDVESQRRFARKFTALTVAERTQICDDICFLPKAKPEFQAAAKFFDHIRDLTASGFYTTDAGMKDLQYIGNVPLAKFEGPPPEVLRHLGL